jgi:hypothetical protein
MTTRRAGAGPLPGNLFARRPTRVQGIPAADQPSPLPLSLDPREIGHSPGGLTDLIE